MAVARAEHDRRVASGFLAATQPQKQRVSRLNISALRAEALNINREPVKTVDTKKSRDHLMTCKKRPDPPKKDRHTVGGGKAVKRFIPWCG